MKHTMWNRLLSAIAYAAAATSIPNRSDGRAVYPYQVAKTREERQAHVARRQQKNQGRGGRISCQRQLQLDRKHGRGPSRHFFVHRTDGGIGP